MSEMRSTTPMAAPNPAAFFPPLGRDELAAAGWSANGRGGWIAAIDGFAADGRAA